MLSDPLLKISNHHMLASTSCKNDRPSESPGIKLSPDVHQMPTNSPTVDHPSTNDRTSLWTWLKLNKSIATQQFWKQSTTVCLIVRTDFKKTSNEDYPAPLNPTSDDIKSKNFCRSEHHRVTDERNFTPPDANSSENSRMSLHSARHRVTDERNFTPLDANSSENSRMSLHLALHKNFALPDTNSSENSRMWLLSAPLVSSKESTLQKRPSPNTPLKTNVSKQVIRFRTCKQKK